MNRLSLLSTLCVLLAQLVLAGCATSRVSMDSTPTGAEVYVLPLGDGKPLMIGSTPLTARSAELLRQSGGAGPVMVEFRKRGYKPVKALITDLARLDLTLKMELPVSDGLEDLDQVNALIDSIFEAQRLALSGRFDDALALIKRAEKDAPQIAAAYEIEGGIYFLQKKLPEALDAYRVAAKYNPKNPETIRMRNLLETTLGIKAGGSP